MAEFSQKQIEQLNELFGTPLNLLSQRYGELSQSSDQMSQQIGVLSQSSDQMSQQIGVLSQRYGELSQSSDQMSQQIGVLSQSSDQMSQQIGVLSQRYDEMSLQIEKRFGQMSQQIGAINERQIRQEGCMCADMQTHHHFIRMQKGGCSTAWRDIRPPPDHHVTRGPG